MYVQFNKSMYLIRAHLACTTSSWWWQYPLYCYMFTEKKHLQEVCMCKELSQRILPVCCCASHQRCKVRQRGNRKSPMGKRYIWQHKRGIYMVACPYRDMPQQTADDVSGQAHQQLWTDSHQTWGGGKQKVLHAWGKERNRVARPYTGRDIHVLHVQHSAVHVSKIRHTCVRLTNCHACRRGLAWLCCVPEQDCIRRCMYMYMYMC